MALIGVHVTIVEPGGFRTGFAQTAHATGERRAEYDVVVGAAVRMQRDYDGRQPGDPAKAAAVLLKLVEMDRPPLRIALGSDAVNAISATDRQRLEELELARTQCVDGLLKAFTPPPPFAAYATDRAARGARPA